MLGVGAKGSLDLSPFRDLRGTEGTHHLLPRSGLLSRTRERGEVSERWVGERWLVVWVFF